MSSDGEQPDEPRIVINMVEDIEGLEARFSRPPGGLGRVVAVGYGMSHRDNRWPSLAGALASLAAATRNHYTVEFNGGSTYLNLYVVSSGTTGCGKETGRTLARLVTTAAGTAYVNDIVSKPALHGALVNRADMLVCIDEFGKYMAEARADKGSHRAQMMTFVMSVYGLAGSFISEAFYSDKKNNKPRVDRPFLSALLSTTPDRLKEALDVGDVMDGMLNRMLVINSRSMPRFMPLGQKRLPSDRLPDDVAAMVKRMGMGPPMPEIAAGEPLNVEAMAAAAEGARGRVLMDEVLQKRHDALREEMDERAAAAGVLGPMWQRAAEQVLKVAGIMTVADAALEGPLPRDLPMSTKTYLWAQEFVTACVEALREDIGDDLSNGTGKRAAIRKAIVEALTELPYQYKGTTPKIGFVRESDLLRGLRHVGDSGRAVKEEIDMMVQAGEVEYIYCWAPKGQRGVKASWYRIGTFDQ
jgi:hypothetical protein